MKMKIYKPKLRKALSLSEADRANVFAITLASLDPYGFPNQSKKVSKKNKKPLEEKRRERYGVKEKRMEWSGGRWKGKEGSKDSGQEEVLH